MTDSSSTTPGSLSVISGPTAVGKGTVVKRLCDQYPQLLVSTSATTRPPRPGERHGDDYWFVTDEEFDDLIANDGLLEWAWVHGTARYGTPKSPVLEAMADGHTVVLEIDLQGARQVRRAQPGAQFIFLSPPSWTELERRLTDRGTETPEQQARRLKTAREEMAAAKEFDHVVVNGQIEETVSELVGLLGL